LREKSGSRLRRHGSRLLNVRDGNPQIVIIGECSANKVLQRFVMKNLPPRKTGERVCGNFSFTAKRFRSIDGRTFVIGSNRATSEKKSPYYKWQHPISKSALAWQTWDFEDETLD
jgi:hypothetical protein